MTNLLHTPARTAMPMTLAAAITSCATTKPPAPPTYTQGNFSVETGNIETRAVGPTGLSDRVLHRGVRGELKNILDCYRTPGNRIPRRPKTVDLRFFVEAAGAVSEAKATGLGDRNIEDCLADVVAAIEFPKSKNGEPVAVYYPLIFRHAKN